MEYSEGRAPLTHPVAMTLAPRSCPSCPILAMSTRGRRPASVSNLRTSKPMRRSKRALCVECAACCGMAWQTLYAGHVLE